MFWRDREKPRVKTLRAEREETTSGGCQECIILSGD